MRANRDLAQADPDKVAQQHVVNVGMLMPPTDKTLRGHSVPGELMQIQHSEEQNVIWRLEIGHTCALTLHCRDPATWTMTPELAEF